MTGSKIRTTRRRVLGGMAAFGIAPDVLAKEGHDMDAFFVPAEDAPHELTLMQWPVALDVYDNDRWFLEAAQQTIADIANAIAEFEPVILLADAAHHDAMRQVLSRKITIWDIPTEDLWCRDAGPIVAVDPRGNRAVQHIQFNGWGGKQQHKHDGRIAERVADRMGFPLLPTGLHGEAGGVEQNGDGLLMAHESSWVIPNRNPGMTRDEVGAALCRAYGADRVLWSPGVKDQDITDYHIDSLARFTGPHRVLMNLPDTPDPRDAFHMAALDTHDALVAAGLSVEVIPEPEIRRVSDPDFVASYANFYVCNGAVIAPTFGDRDTDKIAVEALQRHFPDREIVTLNVDVLGELGGGIHCATHEVPSAL